MGEAKGKGLARAVEGHIKNPFPLFFLSSSSSSSIPSSPGISFVVFLPIFSFLSLPLSSSSSSSFFFFFSFCCLFRPLIPIGQ